MERIELMTEVFCRIVALEAAPQPLRHQSRITARAATAKQKRLLPQTRRVLL
jgi:hypothetical protein